MKKRVMIKVIDSKGFYDYVNLHYLPFLIKKGKVIAAPVDSELTLEELFSLNSQGIVAIFDGDKKRLMFLL